MFVHEAHATGNSEITGVVYIKKKHIPARHASYPNEYKRIPFAYASICDSDSSLFVLRILRK